MMDEPTRTARRFRYRLWMLALGLAFLAGAAIYHLLSTVPTPARLGWEAVERGDFDQAIAHFDTALAQQRSADALAGRAWAEVGQQRWDPAFADSDEAIRLDPNTVLAYLARGNAQAGRGQVQAALADLNEALRRNPQLASAYFHRARVGHEFHRAEVKPLDDLAEAVRLDPSFAPAHSLTAWLRYENGENKLALEAANRALALDPNEALAYLARGCVRLVENQEAAGGADLQRALALEPELAGILKKQPRP